MQKCFKLLFAALFALASIVPAQADVLTVYDDNQNLDANQYVPIWGGYYDALNVICQVIYPESDIQAMQGALINSMKFYIYDYYGEGNPLNGGKVGVYMGVTDLQQFSGYSPELIEDVTKVAEITMTEGETEVVVNFSQPFAYTGGNLVVKTIVEEAANYSDLYFLGQETTFNASMYRLPSSGSAYAQKFGPKTTFEYVLADDYATISTQAINFGKIYAEEELTQTFTLNNLGTNAFTPAFSGIQAPFSIEPAPAEIAAGSSMVFTVKFAPTALGEYAQTLVVNCGAAGQFEVALNGIYAEMPNVIDVCDGTDTDGYLPFYGYYYDAVTKGQMIYTEDMLSTVAGKKITSVTFYPTAPMTFQGGKLQLSFKTVEQDGFTTYTALTDLTAVATWEPEGNEEALTFVLDEPYEYTGGNLAIEVSNIVKGSNYPRCYFYGQNMTDYYPSFYIYGSQNDKSHFLPKVGFGYEKEETPEFLRGDVDKNGEVKIADVTALINYLLSGDASSINLQAADCDQNGEIKIADVTALINYLLSGSW